MGMGASVAMGAPKRGEAVRCALLATGSVVERERSKRPIPCSVWLGMVLGAGGGAGRTRLVPLPRFRTGSHTGRSQMPVAGPREGHGANMGHEAWMGSASALYPPSMPRKWSRAHAHSHLIVHKGWETWAQSQDGERMQKNDSRKRFNRHFAVNSRTHVVEELIWRSF